MNGLIIILLGMGLAGLLFWQVGWLRAYRFSDALFLLGMLQLIIGGAALMGSPVDEIGTPWLRMWARTSSSPKMSEQIMADFTQKESFFVRVTTSGLLTMLLSDKLGINLEGKSRERSPMAEQLRFETLLSDLLLLVSPESQRSSGEIRVQGNASGGSVSAVQVGSSCSKLSSAGFAGSDPRAASFVCRRQQRPNRLCQ